MNSGNRNNPPTLTPTDIPMLTNVVDTPIKDTVSEPGIDESQLAALQTELASRTFNLADQLLHAAFQEMEAALFEQVSNRLRKELPELIDSILRESLKTRP